MTVLLSAPFFTDVDTSQRATLSLHDYPFSHGQYFYYSLHQDENDPSEQKIMNGSIPTFEYAPKTLMQQNVSQTFDNAVVLTCSHLPINWSPNLLSGSCNVFRTTYCTSRLWFRYHSTHKASISRSLQIVPLFKVFIVCSFLKVY